MTADTASQNFQGFRLSPQQRRAWSLLSQASPTGFLQQARLRLNGPLNTQAFRKAVFASCARNEILHTCFRCPPGALTPVQIILPSEPLWCEHRGDNSALPWKDSWTPNLEQGPVLKMDLVRYGSDHHELFIQLPNLNADRASILLLVEETAQLYERETGHDAELEDPIQYADLAEWLNESLEGEESEEGVRFWKTVQSQSSSVTWLEDSAVHPFQPDSCDLVLDDASSALVSNLARQLDEDPSTLFLGAWIVLLSQMLNREMVPLAIASDGRNYEELEGALGPFYKNLPLIESPNLKQTFPEMLAQLHTPLELMLKWQECLDPNTQNARTPFIFEYAASPKTYTAGNIEFNILSLNTPEDHYKLKLSASFLENTWRVQLQYDRSLFKEEVASAILNRWSQLLSDLIVNPERKVKNANALTEDDKKTWVVQYNQTIKVEPFKPIHRYVEQHAANHPERMAVICDKVGLTFQQLNQQANQLAHLLKDWGLKQGELVGILLNRSVEMTVSLLAIHKAGGGYLPLDSSLPMSRNKALLQESGARFLISHQAFSTICEDLDTQIIDLGAVDTKDLNKDNLPNETNPSQVAYVIYTSGSTGRPKGVIVEHQQLTTFVRADWQSLATGEPQHFAMISTFAADLGNTPLYAALYSGGCLHILSEQHAADATALGQYFESNPVDHLKITPSHLEVLMNSGEPTRVLPRKQLVIGGEALDGGLTSRIAELSPNCRILNHYGPTETTVEVTGCDVTNTAVGTAASIGKPFPNSTIYLLDATGKPTPPGIPGQLHIGGACVARGYLNQPALTAAAFIPDPFSNERGKRLYNTGDLAVMKADGNLLFLGRTDDQVKIHGYRVEPGEIAAQLKLHPAVGDGIVLAYTDDRGAKRLAAYLTVNADLKTTDMRAFAESRLPHPMVPSNFIILDKMPLTHNGKIDKTALPEPAAAHQQTQYTPPSTIEEQTLVAIWEEVLKIERIGVHDNFFSLGGDSIIAIQLNSKASRAGLSLSPRDIFKHQTVAELALAAGKQIQQTTPQGAVEGLASLTPIQRHFFQNHQTAPHHYNQAVMLTLYEKPPVQAVAQMAAMLVDHHDALKARVQFTENNPHLEYGKQPDLFQTMVLEDNSTHTIEACAQEVQGSLVLEEILARFVYITPGPQEPPRLLIVIHHLVVDGVSWRILLEDFDTLYKAWQNGTEPQLPPKTVSFKQWSEQLINYANSDAALKSIAYWNQPIFSEMGTLPTENLEGPTDRASASTVTVSLDESETAILLKELPGLYQTQINDALLAALLQAFHKWGNITDLLISMEGHGREDIGLDCSRTVGWFTSRYPVALHLEDSTQIAGNLKKVKETLRAIPNQGFDFKLLRPNAPEPLISFNFLGQFQGAAPNNQGPYGFSSESTGNYVEPAAPLPYLLDWVGQVDEDCLQFGITFSRNRFQKETVQGLANAFIQSLRDLLALTQDPAEGGYTPSDFPLADLGDDLLDKILDQL